MDSGKAAFGQVQQVMLCADDFGMSEAVDNGILKLAEGGKLHATSCLVLGPTFARHAGRLQQTPLQCGVHLNFTEAFGPTGIALPLRRLILTCWARQLPAAKVHREMVRQLDTFESVMGRMPDYIDGHQHIHQFPVIRDALLDELMRRYPSGRRPWLRSTLPPKLSVLPAATRIKAAVIAALGGRHMVRRAHQRGFVTNRCFLGVYDFSGGATVYAGLLRQWLQAAQPGDLLMCHPAEGVDPHDPLGAQRHAEFTVINGMAFGAEQHNRAAL